MKKLMGWNICEKKFVRRVEPDIERVKSIRNMAMKRFEKLKRNLGEDVSFLVEDYYEVIKELLVAYLLKKGMRSQNHQCLISYFYKSHPEFEMEAFLISQMSFFRNRLGYYGEEIPREFYDSKKEEFDKIIDILLRLVDGE